MPSENPLQTSSLDCSLRLSDELLRHATGNPSADGPVDETGNDVTDDLMNLAWFNQYQLAVLVPLVSAVQPAESTVAGVIELAGRVGNADAPSVGAAATLVSVARDGDEHSIADCLGRMMGCFTDAELRDGAAALTTALTLTIADVLAIEPNDAWAEMLDAIAGRSSETSGSPSLRRHLGRIDATGRRPRGRRAVACLGGPLRVS